MVECPKCGSENISSFGLKWKCNNCSFEFNKDFEKITNERKEFSSGDVDIKEEKEFLASLENKLLKKQRKEIEITFKEKRGQLKEVKEKEYNESVSLLEECDDDIIEILSLNNVPVYTKARDERIDTLARKFDPSTLKSKIITVKNQYEESSSLLQQYDNEVIDLLSVNNVPGDANSRDRKIFELAKRFDSSTLQAKIDKLGKEYQEKAYNDSTDTITLIVIFLVLIISVLLLTGNLKF